MNRIKAHIRSHNELSTVTDGHEYYFFHWKTCYYYVGYGDDVFISACGKCRPMNHPKIIFTTLEMCLFHAADMGICVACLGHSNYPTKGNISFAFYTLCRACYGRAKIARATFPMKMMLVRHLPILPELATIIIAIM